MVIPTILILAGAGLWLGGETTTEPASATRATTTRAAETSTAAPATHAAPAAHDSPVSATTASAPTVGRSTAARVRDTRPATLGSLIWSSDAHGSHPAIDPAPPVTTLGALADDAPISSEPEPPAEPPTKKPEIPSGGITVTMTEHASVDSAALVAAAREQQSLDITRLGYLELTAAEAAKLGITVTDDGIILLADDLKDAQIRNADSEDRITLFGGEGSELKRWRLEVRTDANTLGVVDIDRDEKPLAIAPIAIVQQRRWNLRNESSSLTFFQNAPTLGALNGRELFDDGSHRSLATRTREQLAAAGDLRAVLSKELLGKLVPVFFRFDHGVIEGTDVRKGAEVCLWYAPTPEFLAALPERYRTSIEAELSTMRQVASANGTVEEACDRIAGKPSYLEVCRVSSGAVSTASASPNPAHGRTTVSFRLVEDRRVSITLHDVNGRYLRHLAYDEERSAGEQRIETSLDGVSQGAYLVAVRTGKGEQAVARLIVQ